MVEQERRNEIPEARDYWRGETLKIPGKVMRGAVRMTDTQVSPPKAHCHGTILLTEDHMPR